MSENQYTQQSSPGSETPSSLLSTQSLSLKIADINISISTDDPEMRLQVEGALKDFLVHEMEPDTKIRAEWRDLSRGTWGSHCKALSKKKGLPSETSVKEGKKLFDPGCLWQLYNQNGSYLFSFTTPVCGVSPYKIAHFDHNFTWGEIHLHRPYFDPSKPLDPLGTPLDQLLFTNLLARGRGAEVHACGVVDPLGNGHLFVAQSEGGKSTIARLWHKHEGVTILSDDRIILRKLDGGIWMYGTPWHGDAGLASPARAPLTSIYFLEKGRENELMPIRRTAAAARLFACSFPPFYSREGLDFTLGFLGEVTNAVPCYELRFVPDQHVVDFIQTT